MMVPLPRYNTFPIPVLKVLHKRTKGRANVWIKINRSLYQAVMREIGLNPNKLSLYGTPEEGWHLGGLKPAGLHRKITLAYRDMHRTHFYTLPGNRGQWALSEKGLAHIEGILAEEHSRPNLTSEYLNKRLKEDGGELHKYLLAVAARKIRHSINDSRVEDHVQTFYERMVQRDALKGRLMHGFSVTDQSLVNWMIRSSLISLRNDGTDPLQRDSNGARTLSEKQKYSGTGKKSARHTHHDTSVVIPGNDETPMEWVDPVANPEEILADAESFRHIWSRVETVIASRMGEQKDLYLTPIARMAEGCSLKEIAQEMQLPKGQISQYLAEARTLLQGQITSDGGFLPQTV